MTVLEVENLKKIYRPRFGGNQVQALSKVTFSVEEGEYVAIMGESGSGKTTLLNMLAALDKPTEGEVYLDGKPLSAIREKDLSKFRRDHLGFVFQDFNLLDTFSLRDNILLPLVLAGERSAAMERKLMPLAQRLGISELLSKYPYEVSGGQKQRVAMARMLAAEPELILLDEPFSALDTYLKWQLEQEMYKHLKEAGKPVIFVSHNRDEVYRLCDTVSCMNRGKMEVMEPLKEFFQNPKTRTAAILSGCKNISAAERVDAHTLRAVDWGVTLHVKEREIADDIRAVGIRAHFLATVERPGEENVFPVNKSEIWEDPFEWNISFRKNAECSWLQWKIAKTDWSPEMGIPKELYLKEEDILLLTDS